MSTTTAQTILVAAAVLCAATAAPTTAAAASTTGDRDYASMFKQFKATHRRHEKAYATTEEERRRFGHFVENMKRAEVHQAANPHATFGVNAFADMPASEFKSYHGAEEHFRRAVKQTGAAPHITRPSFEEMKAAAGKKIDWREKGAVTPVKNQGQCNSCWTFSTTGNIEGQWFLAGHNLTSLSEQELVSCDSPSGCADGGLPIQAYQWLISNRKGQSVTEASLPYVSAGGTSSGCPSNLGALPVGATISSFTQIASSEDAMAAFAYKSGPISIGVDGSSLQSYMGGIITNCISQQVDHAVLIVGFDDANVPPYWIIKNSWAASWGEEGYFRVAKGSNQCLLTTLPTSAIV